MPLLGYWKMSLLAILRLLQAESPRESLPYPESEGLRKSCIQRLQVRFCFSADQAGKKHLGGLRVMQDLGSGGYSWLI